MVRRMLLCVLAIACFDHGSFTTAITVCTESRESVSENDLPASTTTLDAEMGRSSTTPTTSGTDGDIQRVTTSGTANVPAASTWTVSNGDTGAGIASQANVPFSAISQANPTVTWTALSVGQTLLLPPAPTGIPQVTGSLAVHGFDPDDGKVVATNDYQFFAGDGSSASGWPNMSSWLSFNAAYENARPFFGQGCVGNVPGNTPNETAEVKEAIASVANVTSVDPRFILAVALQESGGCVRVPTTAYAHGNPGLLQSDQGNGTCNNNGALLQPCPWEQIYQMIFDGTAGRPDSVCLVSVLNQAGATGAQGFYRAARLYNSGPYSLENTTILEAPGATRCYASDIANRLIGWLGEGSRCPLLAS